MVRLRLISIEATKADVCQGKNSHTNSLYNNLVKI